MLKNLFLLLCIIFSCFGCEKKELISLKDERFLFGTYIRIIAFNENEKILKNAINEAFEEIKRIDDTYNSKNIKSLIYNLNISRNKELQLDEEGENIFSKIREVYYLSDKKYDITISPLMSLWGFERGERENVPTFEEIQESLRKIDYSQVEIENRILKINNSNIKIDTGSFLKGYAISKAKQKLKENGIKSAFITSISSIETIGKKPEGNPWKIGLQNPENPEEILGIIELQGESMGVSGDYQTYLEINGKKYHHILDKETGYPVLDKKMVAVISEDSFLADMYSTAFYLMPLQIVMDYVNKTENLEVLIIDKNNIIKKSNNFNITLIK
jgi:thiamine biosynthesis lipoprotein